MDVIRRRLQAGFLRTPATVVAAGFAFAFLAAHWSELLKANINPLDVGQKVAFVAAAFSVTAYNLRTRVIDLILKIEGGPEQVDELCRIAKECGKKLTNLVLLFSTCAVVMGVMGFLPKDYSSAKWTACTASALFAMSCVQFLYILFAFERLERFTLDDAKERARKKEIDRLLAPEQPQVV